MKFFSQVDTKQLAGKTCLLRINLDIKDPNKDSLRVESAIPTIKFLLDNGAKVLILSHRGRPDGVDLKLSLKPLVNILCDKICGGGCHCEDPPVGGDEAISSNITKRLLHCVRNDENNFTLSFLENLRFDPREQKNDDSFARELAAKGDFYVNDDFATSHRASASMVAITKYLPSYGGLLLEKEVKNLSKVMDNPEKPLVLIIGGAKIEDKIGVIENFKNKADYILMGSAYSGIRNYELLAHRSLKSEVGGIKNYGSKIIFPEDFAGENNKLLDIGIKTIEKYTKIISGAKTVIWNGPVGMFEDSRYLKGSQEIAEAIIASGAFSVIGGGDTQQLLNHLSVEDKFSSTPTPQGEVRGFISTGGGAMLEFLAGKKLPALEALETSNF